ncbi:hypothetical protein R6Q59_024066, partial [Mikania micrantha]
GLRSFKSPVTKRNLPPQPWKIPLVGHIHHLVGGLPHRTLRSISQKLGPIVHLQLGQVSTITQAHRYGDLLVPPERHSLFSLRRLLEANAEDMCHGALSAKKVQSFRSVREDESQNLIESVAKQRFDVVNISQMIFTMINAIIWKITFGTGYNDQPMLLRLIQDATELTIGFGVSDLYPSISVLPLITGTRNKLLKVQKKIDAMLNSIILDHQKRRVHEQISKHDNEDIVDVLLRLKDDDGLEFPLAFDNIKAVILDMFAAGSDTSAVTTEWVMSELMKNPRVMKKLQHEVRHALKGKTTIHESDIQQLDYLKLVIKETLRLHPPGPLLLPRECRENCEIGGYHISPKTRVVINSWMIGRDPDYWINPEKFIPERFSESSLSMTGTDFEYLPFGSGRRMCPGMTLGLANIELPLVKLLYHFDWQLPKGENIDMSESFGATLKRKNNLFLVAHPYDINN